MTKYNISFFTNEFAVENFQFCNSKELRFYNLFFNQSDKFRFGFLIYVNGLLIGAIKIKGEKNMLSLKTSYNSIPLEKFRIYSLPIEVIKILISSKYSENKNWIFVNFKKIYLKDSRINLENFEELKRDKNIKNKDYYRDLENSIQKEYSLWEHRKSFDIEFNEEFFEK